MTASKTAEYKKGFEDYSGIKRKTLRVKFTSNGVDPQIRNAVIELNKHGFQTVMSCAGHTILGYKPTVYRVRNGISIRGYGYIIVKSIKYNRDRVFGILKKHGLSGLQQHSGTMYGYRVVTVAFNPVGHKARSENSISWITVD
jgi:hypothetical protein